MQFRYWIFVILILAVAGYFFYEAKDVIFYPALVIFEPKDFSTIHTSNIHIAGQTRAGLQVWVYGKIFQADENGNFEGDIVLKPGYNEVGILVKDKFGKETTKILHIVVE